jgi:hypothetical protein
MLVARRAGETNGKNPAEEEGVVFACAAGRRASSEEVSGWRYAMGKVTTLSVLILAVTHVYGNAEAQTLVGDGLVAPACTPWVEQGAIERTCLASAKNLVSRHG